MSANPIRRGLPREPGGEPWPPAGEAPVTAEEPAADDLSMSSTPVELPVEVRAAVRRGLPRVSGGEPWPPAGEAASATPISPPSIIDATSEVSGAPTQPQMSPTFADRPIVATPASTSRTGLPRPGVTVAAPTTPGIPAGVSTASPRAPRPPLPFTPTVWAGAAASGRRASKPEPERYGPFTRRQWVGAVIVAGIGLLFAAAMVVSAVRWLVSLDAMQDFLTTYPGEYHLPVGAPVGFPAWLGWQHFLNTFFILLIIRSGLQVRNQKKPPAFWTPRWNKKRKISLALWFHQSLDILWVLNGVVFIVLLFVTGQWMRIVPTSWEVFPNAVSAALQYVSLDWPTENGWVNYNSLQQISYFTVVFVAAPLAIITGVRMSGIWPAKAEALNRLYPVEWARAVHFPVMLYFVAFIVVHVALVFATGALRNLNHMYAAQDVVNWTGFWIFVASMVVLAAGWVSARPLVLAPIARIFGTVKGR